MMRKGKIVAGIVGLVLSGALLGELVRVAPAISAYLPDFVPDETAFTPGTSNYGTIGGLYQTTSTSNPLTTGQGGAAQVTINRALHVNLRNSTGTEIGTSSNPVQTIANLNVGNSNTQPHICGSFKYVHITTATDTQIVNSSGSTNIYICDFEFSAAAAQNFYFEKSSTGTCGSPTQIGPLWTLAANEGKAAANAFYRGFNTGSSQQLCVNTSASAGIDIGVYYDQY